MFKFLKQKHKSIHGQAVLGRATLRRKLLLLSFGRLAPPRSCRRVVYWHLFFLASFMKFSINFPPVGVSMLSG